MGGDSSVLGEDSMWEQGDGEHGCASTRSRDVIRSYKRIVVMMLGMKIIGEHCGMHFRVKLDVRRGGRKRKES